jgi:hypothetical protein
MLSVSRVTMRVQACIALLVFLSACATSAPPPKEPVSHSRALANLRKAVALPWRDDGRCVVVEAENPWSVVVERCFQALEIDKLRFRDVQHRCPVASADAATVQAMVGFCLLVQPELVVGAVVVVSAFVVAVAIVKAIDAYELKQREEATRKKPIAPPVVKPAPEREPDPSPEPKHPPLGPDILPPSPDSRERRPECEPRAVPHKGEHDPHNQCADRVPGNGYAGWDVLVNGKSFDALQPAARMLWEVKTNNFDDYTPFLRRTVVADQLAEFRTDSVLAKACGYDYTVGVLSAAHRDALLEASRRTLNVVVMDWCAK